MDAHRETQLRLLMFSAGFRFFSTVFSMGIGFFMMPFVIGILGKEDNGLFVLVGSVIGSLSLLEMGLNTAVSRNIAASIGTKDVTSLNQYYNSGFFLFLGVGIVCSFISLLLAVFAKFFFPDLEKIALFSVLLVLVGVQFSIQLPLRAFSGLLSGSLRHDLVSVLSMMLRLANCAATVVILLCGGRLVALAIAGLAITTIGSFFWYLAAKSVVPESKINIRFVKWTRVKELYKYASFSFVSQIAKLCNRQLTVFVITLYLGLASVTIFSVATTLSSHFGQTVMLTSNILSPAFAQLVAQKQMDTLKKALRLAMKISIAVSVFITFGFIAWGNAFITRWVGDSFAEAYPALVLLCIAALLEFSQSPAVEYLYGTSNHHFYARVCSIEALLMLFLCPVLTYYFGLFGTAYSIFTVSCVVHGFLLPRYICRVLAISWREYFHLIIGPFSSALIGIIIPCLITYQFLESNYPSLFAVGIASTCAYIPVIFFCTFSSGERSMLLKAIKRKKV